MARAQFSESGTSRVARSRAQARASYDRISAWYDPLAGLSERTPRDAGLRQLGVQPGERVLEIGCGAGHALASLGESVGSGGGAYGIDLSGRMCRRARIRVARHACGQRTSVAQADGARLPFPSVCFDAVFLSFTLELFDTPEIPLVLDECRRVLRDGGRVAVVALSKACGLAWMTRLYERAHQRWPGFLDCRPVYACQALEDAGYAVSEVTQARLGGLGIEIVTATKRAGQWQSSAVSGGKADDR